MTSNFDHNLCFFTVVFNPESNTFNIVENAILQGYDVYVYINRASDDDIRRLRKLGAKVLGENENVGLGVAFYELEQRLEYNGGGAYIYFDQDTVVERSTFREIARRYEQDLSKNNNYFIFYTSEDKDKFKIGFTPSSGCLFRVDGSSLYHNNEYYVECVDYEFCCRTIIKGGNVKIVKIAGIDHHSLQDSTKKKFLGREIKFRVYPTRRVLDFNLSHYKLVKYTVSNRKFKLSFFLLKSLVIFNLFNIRNRILDSLSC